MMRGQLVLSFALVAALVTCLTTAWAATSRGTPLSAEERFARASAELEAGSLDAAVLDFESLADIGFTHPDASYNRGLAYARRASSHDEQPGDLGRAAAGFEEAQRLRPGDPETERALDAARAEITRRRARRAKDDIIVRPSLDRAVVALMPPGAWFAAASGVSVLFALGLVLFLTTKRGALHVAGSVMAPTFGVLFLALAPIAWFSQWLVVNRKAGVVVVAEITLTDEAQKALPGSAVPEGASVEVGSRIGDRVLVRWGSQEGYAPATSVRLLAGP